MGQVGRKGLGSGKLEEFLLFFMRSLADFSNSHRVRQIENTNPYFRMAWIRSSTLREWNSFNCVQGGLQIKKCLNSSFSFQLECLPLIRRRPWKCRNKGLFSFQDCCSSFNLHQLVRAQNSQRLLKMCWDYSRSRCETMVSPSQRGARVLSVAAGLGSPSGICMEQIFIDT